MTDDRVTAEVLAAAKSVVQAFGAHNTAAYFDSFSPAATFIFYNHSALISSRAAYQTLWSDWERQGFQVLGCRSLDGTVHVLDDNHAIFTHRVRTRLAGEPDELRERETIVFRRFEQGWIAVHEHLSAEPDSLD